MRAKYAVGCMLLTIERHEGEQNLRDGLLDARAIFWRARAAFLCGASVRSCALGRQQGASRKRKPSFTNDPSHTMAV